jgi:carnitine O-acetyltransferase
LRNVVQQVESTPVEQRQPAVGVLTSEHRDTWGPVRMMLYFVVRSEELMILLDS